MENHACALFVRSHFVVYIKIRLIYVSDTKQSAITKCYNIA